MYTQVHDPSVAQFSFEKYKTSSSKLAMKNNLMEHITIISYKDPTATGNNNNNHCQQQCLTFIECFVGIMQWTQYFKCIMSWNNQRTQ